MSSPQKTTRTDPYMVHNGISAEDIEDNSVVLKVICPELLPNALSGGIGAGITTGASKLKDRDGNSIGSTVTTANHIVATWEGSPNMRRPPRVRKGEPVELYKLANQDKFYWRPTGRGRDFRTTDTLHFEVGAMDPTKPGGEKNDTNTYSAYLDSHNKKVGMKTSQANGESTSFSMEADLDAGTFHISDNSTSPGNRIYLDTGAKSGVPTFQVNLTSGVVLKFENENAFIKIPKKFEIDAGERIVFNSPIIALNLTQAGAVIINAASVAVNGAKDFVVTAASIGLNGATKVGNTLVAAAIRVNNLVKGSAGSNYTPVRVDRPQESPVSMPSNSPDTSTSGTPYNNP